MKSIVPSSFALLVALLAVLAVADNVLRTEARQFEGAKMSWDMKSSSEPDPDRATPRIQSIPVPVPPVISWDHIHGGQHNADNVLHTEARQFEGTEMSWDMKSASELDPDCATPRIKPLPINPPVTSRDHIHGGQHNEPDPDRASPDIEPVPVPVPPVTSWDHIHGGQQERNQCHQKVQGHCLDPKQFSNPPIHIRTMKLRQQASWHPVQIIPGSATGGQHIDVGKPEISSIELDLDHAKPRIKTLPYPPKGEQIHAGQHNDLGKAESSIEPNKGCMRPSPHCR